MTHLLTKDPATYAETRIDDEIVIMNLASGDFFSLQDSAAVIWDLLDGSRDRAAVLAALGDEFDVAEAALTRDLDTFLGELRVGGLITGG